MFLWFFLWFLTSFSFLSDHMDQISANWLMFLIKTFQLMFFLRISDLYGLHGLYFTSILLYFSLFFRSGPMWTRVCARGRRRGSGSAWRTASSASYPSSSYPTNGSRTRRIEWPSVFFSFFWCDFCTPLPFLGDTVYVGYLHMRAAWP